MEEFEYVVREGDTMFSICSYIAETEEAINLVEGEKIYIIGKIFILHKMLPPKHTHTYTHTHTLHTQIYFNTYLHTRCFILINTLIY